MIVGVIMYMIMCMAHVLNQEDWTGWSPVSPDTGAKPGHAMLPNMGYYHLIHSYHVVYRFLFAGSYLSRYEVLRSILSNENHP